MDMASASGPASAINSWVMGWGNSRITATAAREMTMLAAKQHFSIARTREYFPAPQLYPTAGCKESQVP